MRRRATSTSRIAAWALQKRAEQQERARQRSQKELDPALRAHLHNAFVELAEGYALADAIWHERLLVRDRALSHLERAREELELDSDDVQTFLIGLIDHAMAADHRIDRAFWLRAAADLLLEVPLSSRTPLFHLAARRIHGTHAVRRRERLAASRRLAAMAVSLRPAST